MATSFNVNKADLQYILKQIKIAEDHAGGKTLVQSIMDAYSVTAANAAQLPAGLRTVDGTYNNLLSEATKNYGAADTLFPRLTNPVFRNDADGDSIDFDGPGPAPAFVQGNYASSGSVVDADPRIISNLIVDMSVDNPAAIDAYLNNPLSVDDFKATHLFAPTLAWFSDPLNRVAANEALQTIPNRSPDIGLSPGFNSWMTFFGQFFDHGLDLVTKSSNGTVYIPLQADDPLIAGADGQFGTPDDLPAHLQFMALTRAKPTIVNGVPQHENTTTSWIDQNQTYTSHPSHQVFLREYVKDASNHAVSTGRLIDGSAAGNSKAEAIGNWGEVKSQALLMLGINLNDFDIHNTPLLKTDQYGKFIPGANGFAQLVMAPDADHLANWFKEGNSDGTVTTAGSIGTNHAFLNDIAHHASPRFVDHDHDPATPKIQQVADSDPGVTDDNDPLTYDDEMLNSHFITGDGRGNENIALTTVHSIFHSEHNRLVDVNKATIAESAVTDPAFVKSWLLNGSTADMSNQSTWVWDGERAFQAARFTTEMQYQHLVFEEFGRRIQPNIDPFIFNNSPNINPSIVAEFAHTVYRFGHSMLTGTVDRLENDLTTVNGDAAQKTLLAVFLNPQSYLDSGTDVDTINANIIRGLSRDVGNAMDEMIVTDVRSNLLGLPLDLGALNLARGRETGIPSLNETRAQLFQSSNGLADLKPYTDWADFATHIQHPMSIINFIAAYGTHGTITAATTLVGKRGAAIDIMNAAGTGDADALAFLNGTGIYASGLGGLNDVDLWIGGLAEAHPEFGGMLGTTFNYVFEAQMENLQFGDRMYYLTRTQGTNLLNNLEPNTFSDLVMRNTALGDKYSTHLNGALFVTPDFILELDRGIAQEDYNGALAGFDPNYAPGEPHPITSPNKVTRSYVGSSVVDGNHDVGATLKFIGGEHVVVGGTEGNDRITTDRGIDTLWGDGGNDYLNAGTESDDVFGGEGDDIIEDPFGNDVLRGNQGNDVISSARGADLLFGDEGNDYIMLGQDAAEIFGGEGNDFMLGGAGKDFLLGNEGDDWIEGAGGFDTIAGDNSELFFNSPIIGHDVLFGQGDETDYDAESGDDIMGSGPSVFRYEGMFGFDWGIAKYDTTGVNFDLQIPIFTTIPNDVLRDRFDQVEGLSGWKFNDHLDGDDRGHKGGGSSAPDSVPVQLFAEHLLTQEGINRITGLNDWFGGFDGTDVRQTLFGGASPIPGSTPVSTFRDGNILMGGDGNDVLRGRGGYDLLDGDAWLNVRIKIVHNGVTYSAESMNTDTTVMGPNAGKVYNVDVNGNPDFASAAFGGATLSSLMTNRTLNPGELSIVREIKYDDTNVSGVGQNIDTAIFQGTMAEYQIEGLITDGINYGGQVLQNAQDLDGDGFIFVRDKDTGAVGAVIQGTNNTTVQLTSRGNLTDDRDFLKNVEQLQFADRAFYIGGPNNPATGTVTIADQTPFGGRVTPYVGQQLVPTLSGMVDLDGVPLDVNGLPIGLQWEWQTTEVGNNAGWSTITTNANPYTVRSVDPGHILRAVAVFNDNNGITERIYSVPTDNPTNAFSVNENSVSGTIVGLQIPFNVDYDPQSIGGNPPVDVALTNLYHEIDPLNSAGGRFKVVLNGVDFNQFPRYSLVVDQGGPVLLDYEALQTPADNQYQVVVNTYSAPPANGGVLVAVRQFTIFLNDINPEIANLAPVSSGPVTLPAIAEDSGTLIITSAALLANIMDSDGPSPLSVTSVSIGAGNGTLVNNNNGTWSYTPAANDDTQVSFSFTATDGLYNVNSTANLDITPVNDLPVSAGPVTLPAIAEDSGAVLITTAQLLTSFTDLDGPSPLSVTAVSIGAGNGTLVNNNDGTWSYTPAANDDTQVTFNFTVTDGLDNVNSTANLDITPVNDAPISSGPVTLTATAEDTARVITTAELLANITDVDGPSLTVTAITIGTGNGSIVNNNNGTWTYTPALNDDTAVSFNFTVSDGIASVNSTASLDITPVNDAPNDIRWTGVRPADGVVNSVVNTGLPAANTVIANLSSTDVDSPATFTYALAAGSSADFAVSAAGVVTRTGSAMSQNTVYTLNINSTDTGGATRTEIFTIRTGINSNILVETITADATDNVIYGSGGNDTLNGLGGDDNVFGQAGSDVLNGGAGNDILIGGGGADTVNGDAGNDTILHTSGDGNGSVNGGADIDTLNISGTAGNNGLAVTYAGAAITVFDGNALSNVESVTADLGAGTDTLSYTSAGTVSVNLAAGTASGFTSIANIENVNGSNGADTLVGDGLANTLNGGGSADSINGGGGNDILLGGGGNDIINGGADNDTITGGGGTESMSGGTGNDIFVFNQTNETGIGVGARDVITDFQTGDIINLSAIDANSTLLGNNTFSFIGNSAFSDSDVTLLLAAGQIRYSYIDTNADTIDDSTLIQGNVNNNLATDFAIVLQNYTGAVVATDFAL